MLGVFALIFPTLFAAPQAAPRLAPAVTVVGVVQDQTTAILPGAQIALRLSGSQAPAQTAVSDATGHFRFERVVPGLYDIRAEFPGFKTTIVPARVGTRAPSALTIVL